MKSLVVDDEPVVLGFVKTLLKVYGEVVTATNGKDGIDAYVQAIEEGNPFELVTIDVEMPDMNGNEMLAELNDKEKELMATVAKKIILTSEGTAENVKAAVINRADSFIVKPITKITLHKKLIEIGLLPHGAKIPRQVGQSVPVISSSSSADQKKKPETPLEKLKNFLPNKFKREVENAVWKTFRGNADTELRLMNLERPLDPNNILFRALFISDDPKLEIEISFVGIVDSVRRVAAGMKGGILEKLDEGALDSFTELMDEIWVEFGYIMKDFDIPVQFQGVKVERKATELPNSSNDLFLGFVTPKSDMFLMGLTIKEDEPAA